ncbi:heterodisulfide reductase-related iron-sulfur binding cluster [Magnetospirillum sp. LM-5]|uniref:heterodisulfide reductase-related iron-sulfur binding cluster n=1 Tax=Magnetospirillum sp. LM-5 TaxID=2681466 RepID=UPI00156EB42E|nr:heterodisulfide reductase-related iron-sulfur binding cluster [Magnetospirillum sp. LM-5]
MREGSLEAPVRHPYAWKDPDFTDPAALDAEMRRQFEICHGCRRCFNLCDSFPRLFDLIDAAGDAELPTYASGTFLGRARKTKPVVNTLAPAFGRKAVLFSTCFVNFNTPSIGTAALAVLAHNGVEVEAVHPECCGMPQLEHGDLARVGAKARRIAKFLLEWVDRGYDVVAPVPSCALMMKFEWPLIEPDDADVARLARAVYDVSEYVVMLARDHGLASGLTPIAGGVALHVACHARAQNIGAKGAEMLRLIPDTPVTAIERCSGHGGAWGVAVEHFPLAMKVGRPAMRQLKDSGCATTCSECPLAGAHLVQGMADMGGGSSEARHPIEILARAYGLEKAS